MDTRYLCSKIASSCGYFFFTVLKNNGIVVLVLVKVRLIVGINPTVTICID